MYVVGDKLTWCLVWASSAAGVVLWSIVWRSKGVGCVWKYWSCFLSKRERIRSRIRRLPKAWCADPPFLGSQPTQVPSPCDDVSTSSWHAVLLKETSLSSIAALLCTLEDITRLHSLIKASAPVQVHDSYALNSCRLSFNVVTLLGMLMHRRQCNSTRHPQQTLATLILTLTNFSSNTSRLLHWRCRPRTTRLPGIHTGQLLGDSVVPGDARADGRHSGLVRTEVGGPDCRHAAQDLLPGNGRRGVAHRHRMRSQGAYLARNFDLAGK